ASRALARPLAPPERRRRTPWRRRSGPGRLPEAPAPEKGPTGEGMRAGSRHSRSPPSPFRDFGLASHHTRSLLDGGGRLVTARQKSQEERVVVHPGKPTH